MEICTSRGTNVNLRSLCKISQNHANWFQVQYLGSINNIIELFRACHKMI
jgi:hypothetical protein